MTQNIIGYRRNGSPIFAIRGGDGTTAVEVREQAAALFKEAAEMVEGKSIDDLTPEVKTAFDAKMQEANEADKQYLKLAADEGTVEGLRERLEFYHGKATGQGIDWSKLKTIAPASGIPHVTAADGSHLLVPPSWGDTFVNSKEYKDLIQSGNLKDDNSSSKFETGRVELKAPTDVLGSFTGAPGAALITPRFLPGILPLPQQPLTIRQLFSQATIDTDSYSYARQTSFENAAAAVAEATSTPGSGLKPQSSIGWTRQTGVIETIATWMAATRRSLSDIGQMRSLIDNQLRLMLELEEEDQLMNGNGTSPNLRGLNNISGVQTLDLTASTSDRANLDGLRTAKRLVRTGAARAQADAVVMNPVDSEEFDLLVDLEGRYRAGDPFGAGAEAPPIWRMRRVESEAVVAGTAWVGAFRQGGTVFQREGIQIFSSDSHADFFVRNLVAVLAEERLGLAIFFPAAFVEVTLAAWE